MGAVCIKIAKSRIPSFFVFIRGKGGKKQFKKMVSLQARVHPLEHKEKTQEVCVTLP